MPLSVETPVIREALVRELFNDPKERAVFWGTPGDCSFFFLEDPKVAGEVDRLKVTARGEARLGADLGESCLSPLGWTGVIELFEKPRLDGWTLRFEVVDSNLFDERHQKSMLTGQLWDRLKESVQPRFGAVSVDLSGPFRELRDFLPTVFPQSHMAEARAALDSMRPVSVRALPQGIVVEAAFEIADSGPSPQPTEAPLTEPEIEAFTARANQWDAFVTFVVKTLGAKTLSANARRALLATLLDARQQIVESLSAPQHREDPVRQLFVNSWQRLRPVAGEIARELPGAEAVQVLTFLAAGDALRALDQVGPSLGIEVSADGLRRMARMIAPEATSDPLDYEPDVDPSLRQLLGFGSPLREEPLPSDPAPPADATPSPDLTPMSWWKPRRWFLPAEAAASAPLDRSSDWQGWVAERDPDVNAYVKRVAVLLAGVSSRVIEREKRPSGDADLFRKLLVATAWQESCWRQFVVKHDAVTVLRSSRASVGMMQVNERVWRGFYEVDKLRWKVAYNAEAGAEVLLRYLDLAREARGTAKPAPAEFARAVYAGYNGGPSQLDRYLDPKSRGKALSRVVDTLFGAKFAAAGDGVEKRVATCLVGGSDGAS